MGRIAKCIFSTFLILSAYSTFRQSVPIQFLNEEMQLNEIYVEKLFKGQKDDASDEDFEYICKTANKISKFLKSLDKLPVSDYRQLISARTRTSIARKLSDATCTGWSIMDCRGFAATATMKDIPLRIGGEYSWEDNSKGYDPKRTEQITTEEILDEEDAAAVAKAYIQNRSFKFQSCDIKTQGNYRIKPGNRLTVKYVGKQSDGIDI